MAKKHTGGRSMRKCVGVGMFADLVVRYLHEEPYERRLLEETYP